MNFMIELITFEIYFYSSLLESLIYWVVTTTPFDKKMPSYNKVL